MLSTALAVSTLCLVLALLKWRRDGWAFAPAGMFLIFNYIATVSVIRAAAPDDPVHTLFVAICTYSLVAFFLSASAVARKRQPGEQTEDRKALRSPFKTVLVLTVLGSVIVVAYYSVVGYSALFEGIRASLSGDEATDIAGLRLESYAGNRYLFPGYVNQFKNAILPACIILIIAYHIGGADKKLALAPPLVAAGALALMGTGQRQALILFVIVVIVLSVWHTGKLLNRYSLLAALLGAAATAIGTFALGRGGDEVDSAPSLAGKLLVIYQQILERALESGGVSKLVGFEYIYTEREVTFGREWAQGIAGVLPGYRGSTIANEIFALLWGSTRGNSPPSIWASGYHNFGYVSIALLPVLLGIGYALIGKWISNTVSRVSPLGAIGLCGAIVSLGFWSSGGPVALLNSGLLAYLFLTWLDLSIIRSSSRNTHSRNPNPENSGSSRVSMIPDSGSDFPSPTGAN